MAAWQDGDRQALEALHRKHARRLVGWLTRKSRDPQVAQDVAQDAWLSVHRFKAGWKQEAGSFGTWLYRIAWNALVDARRYEAPECNAGLERRLMGAIVVPVARQEIGTIQIRNGHEVAIYG